MAHDASTYRLWLSQEGDAFAAALAGDPGTDVPTCPGWSIRDLAAHVGSYHRWVADLLDTAAAQPRAPYALAPGPGKPIAEWYRACLERLLIAIDQTNPTAPMWTVTVDQRAGAWTRRQVGDLTVHRWDAQNARGTARPVDSGMAADLIDELFEAALPYILPFLGRELPTNSLTMRTENGDTNWHIDTSDHTIRLAHEYRPADTEVTGHPCDLLLALWSRPNAAVVSGDPAGLAAWRRAVAG